MQITTIQDVIKRIAYRNRYDLIANDLSRKIFKDVIGGKINFEHNFEDTKAIIKVLKIKEDNGYEGFEVSAYTENNLKLKQQKIYVQITIYDNFTKLYYEQLNYGLYEAIRHELEHYYENKKDLNNPNNPQNNTYNDYRQIYMQLMDPNLDPKERVKLVQKYILHKNEINAYVRSIFYTAKKQKKSPRDIIRQIFKRAFFNSNIERAKILLQDEEVKKILKDTEDALVEKLLQLRPIFKEIFI